MVHWPRARRRRPFLLCVCKKHNIFHFPLMRNTFIDYFSSLGVQEEDGEPEKGRAWYGDTRRKKMMIQPDGASFPCFFRQQCWRRKRVARTSEFSPPFCAAKKRGAQYSACAFCAVDLLLPMMELFLLFSSSLLRMWISFFSGPKIFSWKFITLGKSMCLMVFNSIIAQMSIRCRFIAKKQTDGSGWRADLCRWRRIYD